MFDKALHFIFSGLRSDSRFKGLSIGLVLFSLSFVGFTQAFRTQSTVYRDDFGIDRLADKASGVDYRWIMSSVQATKAGQLPDLPHSPLYFVLHIPFTYLSAETGYRFYTWLLTLCLWGTIFLSLRESTLLSIAESIVIASLLTATLCHSWWFQFEQERGNTNTMVAFFCSAGLFYLSRGKIWLSLLFLTLGAQWRMFPAFLGIFLLLRGGLKPFVSYLLVNAAALFVVGAANAVNVLVKLKKWTAVANGFGPNHNLRSYMDSVGWSDSVPLIESLIVASVVGCFLELFVENGVPGLLVTRRQRRPFSMAEAGLIGMVFELMELLPAFSMPYKLVIQTVPFLLLLTRKTTNKDVETSTYAAAVIAIGIAFGYMAAPGHPVKTPAILVSYAAYAAVTVVSLLSRRGAASSPHSAAEPV